VHRLASLDDFGGASVGDGFDGGLCHVPVPCNLFGQSGEASAEPLATRCR